MVFILSLSICLALCLLILLSAIFLLTDLWYAQHITIVDCRSTSIRTAKCSFSLSFRLTFISFSYQTIYCFAFVHISLFRSLSVWFWRQKRTIFCKRRSQCFPFTISPVRTITDRTSKQMSQTHDRQIIIVLWCFIINNSNWPQIEFPLYSEFIFIVWTLSMDDDE